jgi:hypothetical protein
VQITPATNVSFSWSGDTVLYVQPTSGNLAPNTQYQVTIGPDAMTQNGKPLTTPSTITFVTQPTVAPSPTPAPTPTPKNTGVQKLAPLPSGTIYTPQWSADSSVVYFVGPGGALQAVPAKGGTIRTLVADGVSVPAIAPAGDRLAYVRNGKIVIIVLATNATSEISVTTSPTALTWVKDRLYWGSGDGIFVQGASGPVKLASTPDPSGTVVSIAPDGGHAAFQTGHTLVMLDVATGSSITLGPNGGSTFQGWSPDGSRIMHDGVITDMRGQKIATLPAGDPAWSAKNELLIGTDTEAYEVRPDGTGLTKFADGTFHLPVWAPDSSTFVFVRDGLNVATAPAPPPQPSTYEQANAVVNAFMEARLANNPDIAKTFLDDAGRAAYGTGNPALIPNGELVFKRWYVLTGEVSGSNPDTVRVVVRLVFARGKVEQGIVDENLTVQRAEVTDPFLIDKVTASAVRELGKGPEVVAVKVSSSQVEVTFNSDLVPSTVGGVTLQDGQGMPVSATMTYKDRVLTFSGLTLTPGALYRLVVLPTVQDVDRHHTPSEYDLDIVGPAVEPAAGGAPSNVPSGSPAPVSPSPTT